MAKPGAETRSDRHRASFPIPLAVVVSRDDYSYPVMCNFTSAHTDVPFDDVFRAVARGNAKPFVTGAVNCATLYASIHCGERYVFTAAKLITIYCHTVVNCAQLLIINRRPLCGREGQKRGERYCYV